MEISFRKDKKRKIAYWDKITISDWANTSPPWRPSLKEQKIIGELIKIISFKALNCNIALLGVTPEIRSILAKQRLSVDIIDYSFNMYTIASQFSQANPNENYFQKDWLSFFKQCKSARYDLILGDLIFRLLPTTTLETLLKYMARSLKKNGKLLFRVHLGKKHSQAAPLPKVLEDFQKSKLSKEEIVDRLFFPLSEYFRKADSHVDLRGMKKIVSQYSQQTISKKRRQILQTFIDKWTIIPLSFYVRTKSEIDRLMSFSFQREHCYPSQYGNFINIYTLVWRKFVG